MAFYNGESNKDFYLNTLRNVANGTSLITHIYVFDRPIRSDILLQIFDELKLDKTVISNNAIDCTKLSPWPIEHYADAFINDKKSIKYVRMNSSLVTFDDIYSPASLNKAVKKIIGDEFEIDINQLDKTKYAQLFVNVDELKKSLMDNIPQHLMDSNFVINYYNDQMYVFLSGTHYEPVCDTDIVDIVQDMVKTKAVKYYKYPFWVIVNHTFSIQSVDVILSPDQIKQIESILTDVTKSNVICQSFNDNHRWVFESAN